MPADPSARLKHTAWTIFLYAGLLLQACASLPANPPAAYTLAPTPAQAEEETAANPNQPTQAPAQTSQPANATAAPASLRPLPENFDWKQTPVEPEISANLAQIFARGQAQGLNPQHFSVIGDCQAIPFVFMGPLGRGELQPPEAEKHLWQALNYFEGSYTRESITVRGGFTAASILNPTQADPQACKPGETPLTCEYRLHSPAYVLIALETWLNPETVARYETYLRQILDYVIAKGSIPILLTKADSSELKNGTHVINPAIAKIAYEYQVPLVNFWRAAQQLENYGIDSSREGFHLSQEGYNLKNMLALRALYAVWQSASAAENAGQTAASPQSTPAPIATPLPPAQILAQPQCQNGGCVFFGLASSKDGDIQPQGVFAYEYDNQKLTQILPAGFNLQDVSPDGENLLVNQQNLLYRVNLPIAASELISETLLWHGENSAYWGENGEIRMLEQESPFPQAIRLLPSRQGQEVYFESGECPSPDTCTGTGIYRQTETETATRLENTLQPVFSPTGSWYAFLNPQTALTRRGEHFLSFLVQNPQDGIKTRRVFYLPRPGGFMVYPDIRQYAFSPEGERLFIFYDIYSEYYEKSLRFETYLLNLQTGILNEYGKMSGGSGSLRPKIVWSPEGDEILLFLTEANESGYTLNVLRTVPGTEERLKMADAGLWSQDDYFYLTNLYWRE